MTQIIYQHINYHEFNPISTNPKMETHRIPPIAAVGFSLLPSELIQYIFLQLTLPDIFRIKVVSKLTASIVSDQHFARDYTRKTKSNACFFIYKKRWHRDGTLHGFIESTDRWFKVFSITDMLESVTGPGEDVYFLTASGNNFLFALNTSQVVISVNPVRKTVKKIPPSPLGPRGTSSWRRSGMKLITHDTCHFQFLFVEIQNNNPTLFEYNSETNKWQSIIGQDVEDDIQKESYIFLSAFNGRSESVIIAIAIRHDGTIVVRVVRPRFHRNNNDVVQSSTVGFNWGDTINHELHVYGDGKMMIVRSESVDYVNKKRSRVVKGLELWGLSGNGMQWELVSRMSSGEIQEMRKPYGVMMGCLEEREGKIRGVLISSFEGDWDMMWVCYDVEKKEWSVQKIPDCKMKGSNMAGITFSSGLTLC